MGGLNKTDELIETAIEKDASHTIILYNDDHNTFDHVIRTLVDVCRHSSIQAEQVAWIVHTKGKCDVKHGDYNRLHSLCLKLQHRGLSAVIQN